MRTFMQRLADEMDELKDTPIGELFLEAGFTLEHTGGGILCWQLVDPAKPHTLLWVSVSEDDDTPEGALIEVTALWTCGCYKLDDQGMMPLSTADDIAEDVRGVPAAIEWCKQQLAKAEA